MNRFTICVLITIIATKKLRSSNTKESSMYSIFVYTSEASLISSDSIRSDLITMDDPNYYTAPRSPLFVGKQPKKQCLEWMEKNSYKTPLFTKNVFAYQTGGLLSMMKIIACTPVEERSFYEVVPPNVPCKLFFDLDLKLSVASERKRMTTEMNVFIEEVLVPTTRSVLCDECSYEDHKHQPPYVMRADTNKKISRHVVFPIVFQDIGSVGACVSCIVSRLYEHTLASTIDSGVYTRWRNFRLVGSTKKGKSNHLILVSHKGLGLTLEQQMVRTMLTVVADSQTEIPCDIGEHIQRYQRVLTWNLTSSPRNIKSGSRTGTGTVFDAAPVDFPETTQKVVEFIERTVLQERYPTHGFSRTYQKFNGHDFVDYVISPGVPCPFNGNAPHKSNKTYFKIDLTCNVCFFRCADPSCSKKRFGLVFDVNRECADVRIHRASKKARYEDVNEF